MYLCRSLSEWRYLWEHGRHIPVFVWQRNSRSEVSPQGWRMWSGGLWKQLKMLPDWHHLQVSLLFLFVCISDELTSAGHQLCHGCMQACKCMWEVVSSWIIPKSIVNGLRWCCAAWCCYLLSVLHARCLLSRDKLASNLFKLYLFWYQLGFLA